MSDKWKTLETYEIDRCNVKIEARFVTKGKDISESILGDAIYVETVYLQSTIEYYGQITNLSSEAYAGSWTVREKWYNRKKPYNLEKSLELELADFKRKIESHINILAEEERVRIRDEEITDGLPDSLKGM